MNDVDHNGDDFWSLSNVSRVSENLYQAEVVVGAEKKTTGQKVFSYDQQVWFSMDYLKEAIRLDDLDSE